MAKIRIIPNVRSLSSSMKESDSYYLCPTNTVMTGRYHKDDENGQTQYQYATLKAVDENGNVVSGTITVEDVQWSSPIKESDSTYNAPANRVIVGRQHADDENGDTRYATAIVKFNGDVTYIEDIISSTGIVESAGAWFITESNRVITGRSHNDDENGMTYYYSGIITTEFEGTTGFKVFVSLHPNEGYNPMDPMEFIKISRFRQHIAGGPDKGYSKYEKGFIESDSKEPNEFVNIPVSVINEHHTNDIHTNVRPRDEHSDSSYELVFLQPIVEQLGNMEPTGRVPVFTYSSNHIVNGQTRERREYWLFYGYNEAPMFSHQGDWERVTLDIYNGRIVGAWLDQHGTPEYYDANELDLTESNGIQVLTVYSEQGTHATYEKSGSGNTGHGYQWEITKKVEKLADQDWVLYAGAWGEVGMFAASTGPLGPWYKRMDIQ